jgi:hypothetical protein
MLYGSAAAPLIANREGWRSLKNLMPYLEAYQGLVRNIPTPPPFLRLYKVFSSSSAKLYQLLDLASSFAKDGMEGRKGLAPDRTF